MKSTLFTKCESISKITDNVYLGDESNSRDLTTLKEKNITHILITADYLAQHHPKEFIYQELPLDDISSQDLLSSIPQAIEFIRSAKVVLVHCIAGISRSASIVIAYLMIEKKMKYEDALRFVKNKRPIVEPNPGFIAQLKKLDGFLKSRDFDLKKLGKSPFCQCECQCLSCRKLLH